MTLYTDGLIIRRDRNILDDVVTGQFDAAEAAFDQAMFENPTNAARRSPLYSHMSEQQKVRIEEELDAAGTYAGMGAFYNIKR